MWRITSRLPFLNSCNTIHQQEIRTRRKKRAETLKQGQISSIIVTVIDCSNSVYCTCVHIYALYIHVSRQELDTCCIVATRKNWIKRQHGQRIVRNVLVISSNKTAFFTILQSPAGREKGKGEAASPQKQEEVIEREGWHTDAEPPPAQMSKPPPHRIIAGHYIYTTVSNISRNIQY